MILSESNDRDRRADDNATRKTSDDDLDHGQGTADRREEHRFIFRSPRGMKWKKLQRFPEDLL